jgi:hypothetical protein
MTQPTFEVFRPTKLQVLLNRPKFAYGLPFKLELGGRMVQKLGSFVEGFKNPTTQTSTPKSMEEIVIEVMQADITIKLFYIVVIVNLNMGNLTLEVNNLKNRLATREKEKVVL